MSPLADKMAPIAARLGRIRGGIRRLYALDGLSRLALALGAFVVVTFFIDWALILPPEVRLFFLCAGGAALGWLLFRQVLRPLAVRISDDDLALFVERRYPELNDKLISAIQLVREPLDVPARRDSAYNSPELVEALVREAEQATASIDFGRVIVRKYVGKVALAGGLAAVFMLAGAMWNPADCAAIYINRIVGGARKWPQRTHLKVLDFVDGRRVHARGEDLTIAVVTEGVEPSKVNLEYRFKTGEHGVERMSPADGRRYQFLFPRLSGPFEFTVRGGDDETALHAVDTVTPPSIESVKVFYAYPAYMRKPDTPPDRPEALGNVVAPFHTKVRFEALTNEDLKAARFLLGFKGKEQASPLAISLTPEGRPEGQPRLLKGEFTVTQASSEYALELQAGNGLGNRDDIRFSIKGLEDRLPEIVVNDPLGDEFVTELCDRPLGIEVKDDHGVARIALEIQIRSQLKDKSKDWYAVEFTREENSRDYGEPLIRSESSVDVSRMGLQAGDHVELRFRAEDFKDIGPRNTRLSRVYKLSVVPLGVLEKELQDSIEKIKVLLRDQKNRQEAHWNRSTRLVTNYGKVDLLSPEQQSEVRQAGLEQNDITSRLDGARKDIRYVQRRGVYNKIYNESAAAKLQGAIDELSHLVGDPAEPTRPALSRVAAAGIDQSAKLKSGQDRARALRDAQNIQSQVSSGIQRALEHLEKWSSYQEVIRIARDIKKMQDDNNKVIPQKK